MASDITVEADQFGAALEELLSKCGVVVDEAIRPAVQKAGKTAKREWSANARSSFKGTGKYADSISYTVKGKSHDTHMEAGSKSLPGLPHLLEKGHATIGGGYVPGREHIAPAAEKACDQFEQDLSEAVDRALEEL